MDNLLTTHYLGVWFKKHEEWTNFGSIVTPNPRWVSVIDKKIKMADSNITNTK